MDHKCKNNPDRFCYISGNVVLLNHCLCEDYFAVKLGDLDKPFPTDICRKTCGELKGLKEW